MPGWRFPRPRSGNGDLETMEQQNLPERLPTLFASGLFQLFTLALLFMALIYGQRGLVLLALLLLVTFNGAFFWSRFGLSGLASRLELARDRVFPGEPLLLEALVTNRKYLPVWLQLAVSVDQLLLSPSCPAPAAAPVAAASAAPAALGSLPFPAERATLQGEGGLLWQQQARWSWELKPQKRGLYTVGPLRLAAGDLLGFYKQEKTVSGALNVIVYPRLVPLQGFAAPLQELFGAAGAKSPVVDPVYLVATRDYQAGSPARFIHWKASARHRRLQEKVFAPSAQQKVLLAVDVTLYHQKGAEQAFERTLEAVASLAVQLEQQGRAFGLAGNGCMEGEKELPFLLRPSSGPAQLARLLEMLARLQLLPREGMEKAFMRLGSPTRGLTCLYFTYAAAPGTGDPALELLQRLHIPVLVIGAAEEETAQTSPHPSAAALPRHNPEEGRFFELKTLLGDEVTVS